MSDECCRVNDEYGQQVVGVLGLQHDAGNGEEVYHYHHFVNHAVAYLVVSATSQVVHNAYQRHKRNEKEGGDAVVVYLLILE